MSHAKWNWQITFQVGNPFVFMVLVSFAPLAITGGLIRRDAQSVYVWPMLFGIVKELHP